MGRGAPGLVGAQGQTAYLGHCLDPYRKWMIIYEPAWFHTNQSQSDTICQMKGQRTVRGVWGGRQLNMNVAVGKRGKRWQMELTAWHTAPPLHTAGQWCPALLHKSSLSEGLHSIPAPACLRWDGRKRFRGEKTIFKGQSSEHVTSKLLSAHLCTADMVWK